MLAAARSFTDPPGFCHSAFRVQLDAGGDFAFEPMQPDERSMTDEAEHARDGPIHDGALDVLREPGILGHIRPN